MDKIVIKGAREHNLKNIDLSIPKNKFVVFTGISGSGKSSLAFDTIYAEGQRRYVESLSSYARQFLGVMKKPDVDLIEGLSPAISIDQKSTSRNPRSTVGTVTEIYDYLRLLFARIGHPHCPNCGREITRISPDEVTQNILNIPLSSGTKNIKALILAPLVKDRKGEYQELFIDLKKRGYKKVRIDGAIYDISEQFVLIKTNKHTVEVVIDSVVLSKETDRMRISTDVEQGLSLGDGEIIISKIQDGGFSIPEKPKKMSDTLFSTKFACPFCHISIPEVEPRIFSFNTPHGACPNCNGLGTILDVDRGMILNQNLSISEGGILPFSNLLSHDTWFSRTFKTFCKENGISLSERLSLIPHDKKNLLLEGTGEKEYSVEGENRWGRKTTITEPFIGILNELRERYQSTESVFLKSQVEKFMKYETCPECLGTRLKKEALLVTIEGKSIVDLCDMAIGDELNFIDEISKKLSERDIKIAKLILKEIKQRLKFLMDVGLDYLTLSRGAETLAGGEAQRIRLASQIGSGLTGVLYVLDEPSIGLHQRDNKKLIDTLVSLRDLGNTVLVVEHDQETMESSDYIVDFGPGAGEGGGKIIAQGTIDQIKKNKESLTGKYLSGELKIKVISNQEKENLEYLKIIGATEHNLKNINVSFPLGKLIVVTGVSGSGKSTLINDILYKGLMRIENPFYKELPGAHKQIDGYERIKGVYMIDQSPIGRTPRSNPATYTGAFSYIRELFAQTKDAKLRGYGPGRFSFNVRGGRCEACEGEGQIKIEMQFMPDVYIVCEVCQGTQYNKDALSVNFNGKNIAEVLSMSVSDSLNFFSFIQGLSHRLQTLNDVGLSYIKLGQPAPTLSGGEAQRVKLATELSKRGGNALYLLDEPTSGLHFADLEKLLLVLRRLVDLGNTVIIIEHNLDIIKNADYIIDLGPEGGDKGGKVVAEGKPKDIVGYRESYTGKFLQKVL
ncbi:MAG: excinuclease ABC subunit A [Candidatus Levybacteria bacterium RIFCSPLOWO2_02_FULL_37_11]|nr:MAG: excinuclease ABC subunit A [Candidatus Levybacteria bacterium RIFCSPLOWO2_02_FULL_37_11]